MRNGTLHEMKHTGPATMRFPAFTVPMPARGHAEFRSSLLAGCLAMTLFLGPESATAAVGRIVMESGGLTRTASIIETHRLKVGPRAMIVVLRRKGVREPHSNRLFAAEDLARSHRRILVYPNPVGGHWSHVPDAEAIRDAGFVRDLVAKLAAEGSVDPHRVFVIGIGDGAAMALRLACDPTIGAAGAVVVGAHLPGDLAESCNPLRPVPLMIVSVTREPRAVGGANKSRSAAEGHDTDAALALFGRAAGCSQGKTVTTLSEREAHPEPRIVLERLNGCKVPVQAMRIDWGGRSAQSHASVSGAGSAGEVHYAPLGAKMISEFLHQIGG